LKKLIPKLLKLFLLLKTENQELQNAQELKKKIDEALNLNVAKKFIVDENIKNKPPNPPKGGFNFIINRVTR